MTTYTEKHREYYLKNKSRILISLDEVRKELGKRSTLA
jgi:hypothetical protein